MTMGAPHGFVKTDNRRKQMTYIISQGMGHYSHPVNADVPAKE